MSMFGKVQDCISKGSGVPGFSYYILTQEIHELLKHAVSQVTSKTESVLCTNKHDTAMLWNISQKH